MIRSLLTIYIPSVFSFTDSPQKCKLHAGTGYERVRLEGAISDSAEKVSDIENTENVEQEQGTMGVEYEQI